MEQVVVEKKEPVVVVLFSPNGKPMPSRSVAGLSAEERRTVRAGEAVVLLTSPEFGYRRAVWSGGKIRHCRASAAVMEAWWKQRDEYLAEALAEIHRSAKDKTYKVCVERVTREYAYIPIRAPSANAAEDAAPGIALDDWWDDLEPRHELDWEQDDLPEYLAVRSETEETKELWHFAVDSKGCVEEVQTYD